MTHTDVIRITAIITRKDIIYVDGLMEAYDNLAVMRTIDPAKGIVEFLVSPDFIDDMDALLKSLSEEVGLQVLTNRPFLS